MLDIGMGDWMVEYKKFPPLHGAHLFITNLEVPISKNSNYTKRIREVKVLTKRYVIAQ